MNRLAAIAVLLCLLGCGQPRASLIMHLRCDGGINGKLTITTGASESSYDVKSVCEAREIRVEGYERENSVRLKLHRADGNVTSLDAQYGLAIHSDSRGFYTILKITDKPPYLATENI